MKRLLGIAAALALLPATAAHASTTPPAPASATLYLPSVFVVSGRSVTVPGRRVEVEGFVRPYVPGQTVLVKALQGGRVLKSERLRIRSAHNPRIGRFTASVASSQPGTLIVEAVHARTDQQHGFTVRRSLTALGVLTGYGSSGDFIRLMQQRLAALHFYIPQTGVFDNGTALALDAYHRLLGWGTYTSLDGRTISYLLDGFGQFKVRFPHHGRHAEGDLAKQLLALIDGSKVELIFPISSGKPSTPTILGDFHVYSRVPGYLPDGMYYSDFFSGGYAIHGYNPAPDYPASHGCMRLPIVDAITAFHWLAYGDWVDTYY